MAPFTAYKSNGAEYSNGKYYMPECKAKKGKVLLNGVHYYEDLGKNKCEHAFFYAKCKQL